jgi:hypothetical protein
MWMSRMGFEKPTKPQGSLLARMLVFSCGECIRGKVQRAVITTLRKLRFSGLGLLDPRHHT